ADAAIRRCLQPPVLRAVEIDQPQRFISLSVENLRAPRPGYRMLRGKRSLDYGRGARLQQPDQPQPRGLISRLSKHSAQSVARHTGPCAARPTLRNPVHLAVSLAAQSMQA